MKTKNIRGIPIEGVGGVTFGYVKRQKEETSDEAEKFLKCMEDRLKEDEQDGRKQI